MPWPDLHPVEIPATPAVPWTMWLVGGSLLVCFLMLAVVMLRAHVRRKPVVAPPPHPAVRALHALSGIPDDWSAEKSAAAGARILRAYLAVIGLGPGVAHPAREFSGLRSADDWQGLITLLGEMESIACRPYPSLHHWREARDQAVQTLQQTPWPDGPLPPP